MPSPRCGATSFGQPPRDPHANTDEHAPDTPRVVEWFAAYHSSILCALGACGPTAHKPFRNMAENTHWAWVFETPHDPRPQAGVCVSILAIWRVPGRGQAQHQG
eukprot:1430891-Amphidinium_carterae.1